MRVSGRRIATFPLICWCCMCYVAHNWPVQTSSIEELMSSLPVCNVSQYPLFYPLRTLSAKDEDQ